MSSATSMAAFNPITHGGFNVITEGLGWWILVNGLGVYGWLLWGVGMLVLVSGFAVVAYKGARGLRGTAPKNFTWISEEEFAGL